MLREQLLGTERPLTRSGVERLWKTGRGAVGLAFSALGGRLRGRGEGLAAAGMDDAREMREVLVALGADEPPRDAECLAMLRTLLRGFFAPLIERGALESGWAESAR